MITWASWIKMPLRTAINLLLSICLFIFCENTGLSQIAWVANQLSISDFFIIWPELSIWLTLSNISPWRQFDFTHLTVHFWIAGPSSFTDRPLSFFRNSSSIGCPNISIQNLPTQWHLWTFQHLWPLFSNFIWLFSSLFDLSNYIQICPRVSNFQTNSFPTNCSIRLIEV